MPKPVPARLDPFQNIVNVGAGGEYLIVYISGNSGLWWDADQPPPMASATGCDRIEFDPTLTILHPDGKKIFESSKYFKQTGTQDFGGEQYIYGPQTQTIVVTPFQSGVVWNGINLPNTLAWQQAHVTKNEHWWLSVPNNPPSIGAKPPHCSVGYEITDTGDFPTFDGEFGPEIDSVYAEFSAGYSIGPMDSNLNLILGQTYDVFLVDGSWQKKTQPLFTAIQGVYEKVWMIKLSPAKKSQTETPNDPVPIFKISLNGGYAVLGDIFRYPTSGIEVDLTNKSVGAEGQFPNLNPDNVYFPIKWRKDADGKDILPTAPNGKKWPEFDYHILLRDRRPPPDNTPVPASKISDVVNACQYWMFFDIHFAFNDNPPDFGAFDSGSFTFAYQHAAHYKPPIPDPLPPPSDFDVGAGVDLKNINQKDKIEQIFISTSDFPPIGSTGDPPENRIRLWEVEFYCCAIWGVPQDNFYWDGSDGFYDGSPNGTVGNGLYGPMIKIPFDDEEDF